MVKGLERRDRGVVRRWWQGEFGASELLFGCLLTLQFAIYLLALLIGSHRGGGISEAEEWRIFVLGWALVPAGAIAAFVALRARAARWLSDWGSVQTALVALDAVLLFATAVALRTSAPGWAVGRIGAAGRVPALPSSFDWIYAAFLIGFPLANLGLLLLLRRRGPESARSPNESRAVTVALPFVITGAIVAIAVESFPSVFPLLVLAALASLALVPRRGPAPPRLRPVVDVLATLLLAFICLDPHLHFEVDHHLWFLGPVHALMQGRTLLVDVVSAYGVLPIQLLATFFQATGLPPSYVGLALVGNGLLLAFYAVVYGLLRSITRSQIVAVAGLIVTLLIHFFGVQGSYSAYPSAGPIRFLLPLLVPLVSALRSIGADRRAATRSGELALLAAASLWSVEVFVYTLAAWVGVLAVESGLAAQRGEVWRRPVSIWIALAAGSVALVHGVVASGVRLDSGQWPQWARYLDFIRSFSPAGRGVSLLPAPLGGAWVAVVLAYLASLIGCVYSLPQTRGRKAAARLAAVAGLTLMGIAQLTYWLGLSIQSRLANVAAPAVVVTAFWADRLLRPGALPSASRSATRVCLAAVVLLIAVLHAPSLRIWAEHSPRPLGSDSVVGGCDAFPACLVDSTPILPQSRDALELLAAHAAGQGVAGIFVAPDVTAEVTIRSGRPHAFPITHPGHDATSPRNAAWILQQPHRLVAGDVILVDREALRSTDALGAMPLMRALVARLCDREFRCVEIDRRGPIRALRLEDD